MNPTLLEILEDAFEIAGIEFKHFDMENFEEEISDTCAVYRKVCIHPMCGYQGEFDYSKFKVTVTYQHETFFVKVVEKHRTGKIPQYILDDLENGTKEHEDIDWTELKVKKKNKEKSVEHFEFDNPVDVIKKIEEEVVLGE